MDSNVRSISSGDTSSSRSNDEADTTAWDDMIYAQNAMYKASIKKNAVLQSQVVRLQDELEVWKIGFNSKAQEKEELTAKVARLESVISTMADQQRCGKDKEILEAKVSKLEHHLITIHEENPMVVCLMDGNQHRALRDGAVFSETFLTRGKEGGRDAAASLNTAIRNHVDIYNNNIFGGTSSVSGNDSAFGSTPRRIVHPQIVCTIYMNRAGLSKTLFSNSVCTPQNYLDFFIGFNQALPLFTLVDVGDGKEAADTKLRKSLELYARLPQVRKIFFAGAHDNGYLPTLISLGTEGQLDKLVIIKGHAMAYEFDMFLQETSVDVIALPNLFLRQKLLSSGALNSKPHSFALPSKSSYPSGTSSASIGHATTGSPPTPRGQNSSTRPTSPTKSPQKNQKQIQQAAASGDRFDPKKVSTNMAVRSNAGQHDKLPATTQRQSVARQTPPACIAFYLDRTKCRYDKSVCKHSHSYELSPAQIEEFRQALSKQPCPVLRLHNHCSSGSMNCHYSHQCPFGVTCPKLAAAKPCAFLHEVAVNTTIPSTSLGSNSPVASTSLFSPVSPSPARQGSSPPDLVLGGGVPYVIPANRKK
ncbi:hypothetical protein FRB98_001045 [Tulasnella sp. 332]|nr:hypothetical protein FRB98_001045 [Tulasnella sp. 332]